MSYATLILGESGSGKTASLRNLNPATTLLIQPIRKPLPFRAKGWAEYDKETAPAGTIFVTDNAQRICTLMERSSHDVIVVDDWQYILANAFMARRNEKGYEKFVDIGGAGWDVIRTAMSLAAHRRVYVLAHTMTDDYGNTRVKTLGKMLDDKVVIEGMFTTVLRAVIRDGHHYFSTVNTGTDTVKAPIGLFRETLIDNDLAAIDAALCNYYGIGAHAEAA